MNVRFLFIITLLLSFGGIKAQEFTSLDWSKPEPRYDGFNVIETQLPGFAGAQYDSEDFLPHYATHIELGKEYSSYTYDAQLTYPEFQTLSAKEIAAIKKSGASLPAYPTIQTAISVASKQGQLSVSFIPIVHREGTYQRINSFKLEIKKSPKPMQAQTRAGEWQKEYPENSVLSTGRWVKIRIPSTGIYQITHNELSKMGFKNPAKVSLYGYGGALISEKFSEQPATDLREVPLWREGNHLLFHATGTVSWKKAGNNFEQTQNHFSTYACYFLTESEQTPMTFEKEASLSAADATDLTTFPDYALEEKEEYNWRQYGRKLYEKYDYRSGASRDYSFTLPGITNDAATVTVAFSTDNTATSSVSVSVVSPNLNLGSIDLTRIADGSELTRAIESNKSFSWTGDKQEKTTIRITHNRPTGMSGHLDYIRLNYTRELAMHTSHLQFRPSGVGAYNYIVDKANEYTRVLRIGSNGSYHLMEGSLSGGKYTFTANHSEFVAFQTNGTFPGVEVMGEVANQNLHALKNVDMIVITPAGGSLNSEAERLAQFHREHDNLSVEVVTAAQVYNEFSSGTPDATAYRRLMKMLYDRAENEEELPRYLLLFGDASYDNRMLTTSWSSFKQDDFLLCYPSVASMHDFDAFVIDDYFGFLDDTEGTNHTTDKVDIGIGRLPMRNRQEAKIIVDKIIAYAENRHAGSWKNIALILGDDDKNTESGHVHMYQADTIAKRIENNFPQYQVRRILWDAYKMEKTAAGNRYPDIEKQIIEQFNEGMFYYNYTGHGRPDALSHEFCFTNSHISSIQSSKPPMWVAAACEVSPYDEIDYSMGELLLLHPRGGAIAIYSTTRTVYPGNNFIMNKAFTQRLFAKVDGEYPRLGDVARMAKVDAVNQTSSGYYKKNNLHFSLLGDPALRLTYPERKVVIDTFNEKAAAEEASTINAGGLVTVQGRVLNEAGETAEDFNGTIYPTILDNKEKITTNLNITDRNTRPYVYEEHNKVLFSGSDKIENGTFTFSFPVPMDINYSFQSGIVNLYALESNKVREGNGLFTNFLIGGTDPNATTTDSIGPKINIYLNTPDFVSGGKVDESPYLIAELEDEDGINTSGNGVGHDLTAIVDNSPQQAYVLNKYYTANVGDYKRGTVRYKLPQLSEGTHELLFRAWDVRNNSSTATLKFEVVKGLRPNLFSVDCTISPAREQTTFVITHDRPETELDVQVSVFDFSGKILWTYSEKGTSDSHHYYIPWDLCTNEGQRIATGMYLFQAIITAGGSKESTKANKIVVMGD